MMKSKIKSAEVNLKPGDVVLCDPSTFLSYSQNQVFPRTWWMPKIIESDLEAVLLIKKIKSGHNFAWNVLHAGVSKIVWEDYIIGRI